MNTMYEKPKAAPFHPGKPTVKLVNFYFEAAGAKSVCLSGDFNGWSPSAHPMQRRPDGWWYLQVPLRHGHHLYYFVVDGQQVPDPQSSGKARNERNEVASLIAVS
jgi:1,4-alpha-glucan branching enzyme